jgi:hypothetical protein
MQKIKGDGMQPESTDRNEKFRMVMSDLASVIGHVRNSLELIEAEMASEAAPEEAAGDIIVLDDVTPGYVRAHAVLRDCDAGLSAALCLLQESTTASNHSREFAAESGLPPAH